MRLYFAGPLFSQAEIQWNKEKAFLLREHGFSIFLPQEVEQQHTPNYAPRIFESDVRDGIDTCDAVIAIIDGSDVDSGTAWECGYAFAKNKPVYGIRTDFRIFGPEEKCNLMIEQCCVKVYKSIEDFLKEIEA